MQVTLQGLFSPADEGNAVTVETNSHATVQTLVSNFCTQKGIAFNSKLGVFDGSKRPISLNSTIQSAGITNGQSLYIGYQNRSRDGKQVKWPLYVAIIALVIGLVGILTMSLVYALHGGVVPFDFGVVMDAGSSKTNSLLYQWLGNKHKGTGCIKQIDACKVKGGISEKEPSDTIPKILTCLKKLTPKIDEGKVPETPLYFAATAGMRLLKLSDESKAEEILVQLNNRLNESGMSVRDIDIISGRDEGLYAWIATNFLKNTLDVVNTNPFSPVTYGALDMGGASNQVAFAVPPTEENLESEDVKEMSLYGEKHYVFAKSYLCFGRTEAQRRYHAALITDPRAETISDPCAPKGFSEKFRSVDILKKTCTQTKEYDDWFKEYPDLVNHNFTFEGESDYERCKKEVERLTNTKACEDMPFKKCFSKLPRPLENQKFLAPASYFYTTDFLNVTKSTLEEYRDATSNFCKENYDDIRSKSPFAPQYCFNAVYIDHILIEGFGFNDTTWKNVEFLENVDGKELGWSIGYMINATNMIPEKKPSARLIHPTVLTIFLVIFIIVVTATVVYIFHKLSRRGEEANENGSAQSLYQSP